MKYMGLIDSTFEKSNQMVQLINLNPNSLWFSYLNSWIMVSSQFAQFKEVEP